MELWTREHKLQLIPCLIAMLIIGVLLRIFLGKKKLSVRMIPFQILACIIVLLEIGKQAVSLAKGYDLYHLPFHFCSLFIFMLPIMAFYKGRHRQAVTAVTTAICAALFLLMLIYPNLIYGAWNINDYFKGYMDFHTVTFHNIVMLEFILILALGLHEPVPKGEVKACIWFTVGFCAVSATMAQVLKTNYANYYTCNIPPLEAVRISMQGIIGIVSTQILYILIVSALNVVFVYGAYWFYRLVKRLLSKKQAVTCE